MSADKIELNAGLHAQSEALKEKLQIDDKGIITLKEGVTRDELFEPFLPEGVDKKLFGKAVDGIRNFTEATALATGEMSIEFLKKNADIEKTEAKFNFETYSTIEHQWHAKKEYPNRDNPSEPIVKRGALVTKVSIAGTKAKNGGLGKVAKFIAAQAAKELS